LTASLVLILSILFLMRPAAAAAQTTPASSALVAPAAGSRQLTAVRAAGKIALDGRLDEADWSRATPAAGFLQRDPDEGKTATEATEIRILYDDDAIYVGARMFDREPARIARRLTRRDGDTEDVADAITIGLDPLLDRLTGAWFRVSASGTLGDGVLFNDSSDDDTWDAVWDAKVTTDDKGWTAEMRIPFSQLRFKTADRQIWGVNVTRYVQRTNEETWWILVPKNDSGMVSRFGNLAGLDGIQSRRHLDVLPYVTGRSEINSTAEPGDPFNDGRTAAFGAGLDLKWGFTTNMTMDATVNPDFGQVEVDPAVVNLTAFETFYEERRPFFIEGSQAFDRFGRNGATGFMGFNRTNPTIFYSRRIGRVPQGAAAGEYVDRPSATTILGAAKLTGKTSRGWTVNFIDAATAREFADTATGDARGRTEVEPLTNYLAMRARRDVGQRAGFGVLTTAVNRDLQTPGLTAQLPGSAFVFGGDGHWFFTDKRDYVVTGSFTGSRVAGSTDAMARLQRSSARYYQRPDATHLTFDPNATTLAGWSLQTDFNRNSGRVRPNASFWAVSPGFEVNDAGFVTNVDRMGMHAALVFMKPTPDRFTRNRQLFVAKWNTWNFAHDALGDGYFASFNARLLNYWSVDVTGHTGGWVYSDRLTRGGPIMRAPGFRAVSAELEGDDRKPVEWSVDGSYESRPDGSWEGQGSVSLTFKPLPSLEIRVGPEFTRSLTATQYVRTVTDPAVTAMYGKHYVFGAIDQTELVMDTRVNVILSPKMSIQAYIQPLLSVGRYSGFKEPMQPRTYDFLQYGLNGGAITFDPEAGAYLVQPAVGSPFVIPSPDFNFTSLRVNAVYRWEFKPGSTLYVVWTQQREAEEEQGRFAFNRDIARMMRAPGDNVFMVKMSYWFSR
jgi:hypothetical protein